MIKMQEDLNWKTNPMLRQLTTRQRTILESKQSQLRRKVARNLGELVRTQLFVGRSVGQSVGRSVNRAAVRGGLGAE